MRCAARRLLLVVAAVGALGTTADPAAAATWVSYQQLFAQVRSGHLIRAIINPSRGDVEIKFPNLDEWHAFYPPGAEATLSRALHDRHVRVLYVPRPQAPPPATAAHHARSLAVAGSVCLLAVLLGGWFVRRRKRLRR